ncbi:ADP-ribosylglycohydrolase family protein [Quadrisphaera setariae]|uniref:ADP-ribosylglycohydrolase family protein n=1 Tax=Quadrisphaera setariae TaxID=2593304 RepID=A0A5C8ZFB0_9ACTN|nr:ADP-ribosylglycohydrolase family protein [Quadrisphaera setariae]TXR55490.1 ADP-ribosylglycohydrolase family protein [Quadrisphaera setariae]
MSTSTPQLTDDQLDRAAGVLLGQAVGDALGVPYEFVPDDRLPRLGDDTDGRAEMLGGGLGDYAPGEYSDDTQMAVIIAEVSSRGLDLTSAEALDQIADGFIAWAADGPADIGIQTAKVLRGTSPGPGSADSIRRASAALAAAGERTGGNGALMRTGIVGLTRLHDRQATARAARAVAELTHADPDAGDSCVLWSEAVRVAVLYGRFAVDSGLDLLPAERRQLWADRLEAAARGERDRAASNGWTVAALQDAWTAIASTPGSQLEPALHAAVRTGNDTDTVAAIAGALLGARWGASAVPAAWRDLVHGIGGRRAADLQRLARDTATSGTGEQV